ncbi:MAG: OadG family protein [Ruminococcus sp.]|nr:OadG family protein [Ruminococcus sp.]
MLQASVNALQSAAAELTLYERAISAAKVILTGFVVVFSMLFLLILIIKLYGAIVSSAQRAADQRAKRKERVKERITDGSGVHIIKRPAYVTAPTIEEGIPEEVVAVIAAAVAAYDSTGSKVRIKSIKKANGGRSAWANAGVLDNTRPF